MGKIWGLRLWLGWRRLVNLANRVLRAGRDLDTRGRFIMTLLRRTQVLLMVECILLMLLLNLLLFLLG